MSSYNFSDGGAYQDDFNYGYKQSRGGGRNQRNRNRQRGGKKRNYNQTQWSGDQMNSQDDQNWGYGNRGGNWQGGDYEEFGGEYQEEYGEGGYQKWDGNGNQDWGDGQYWDGDNGGDFGYDGSDQWHEEPYNKSGGHWRGGGGPRRGRNPPHRQQKKRGGYNNHGRQPRRGRQADYGGGGGNWGWRGGRGRWSDADNQGGYAPSRKRGRYHDNNQQQFHEPLSVNFYDEYDDSYHDSGNWHSGGHYNRGRNRQRRDNWGSGSWVGGGGDYSGGARQRRDSSYNRNQRSYSKGNRTRSDNEQAIYEKHKQVTIEKDRRDSISNVVVLVLDAVRYVAQQLSVEKTAEMHNEVTATVANEDKDLKENANSTNVEEKKDNVTNFEDKEKSVVSETDESKKEVKPSEVKMEENEKVEIEMKETEILGSEETSEVVDQTENEKLENESEETTEKSEEKHTDNIDEPETSENTPDKKDNAVTEAVATEKKTKKGPCQVLLGAIRCGDAAMRILVGDTSRSIIVVLSKEKPTRTLLEKLRELVDCKLAGEAKMGSEKYTLLIDDEKESMVLKLESISGFEVLIRLTSPECSADAVKDEESVDPEDVLSEANCQEGLRALRRMRFFIKKLDPHPVSLSVIRVLLDLRSRPGWNKLPLWLVLTLVHVARQLDVKEIEKGADKRGPDVQPIITVESILRKCMQVLSSGILLPGEVGLKDPCEVDMDAGAGLSVQDAEEITLSAQHALRMIEFRKIREFFGLQE